MAALALVLGLCFCSLNSAASPPPSLKPAPVSPVGAPRRPDFLNKASKEVPKSPAVHDAVKTAAKTSANKTVEAIMHPKVEYDPDTAALMKQADDAIKEAESADKAPPPPAPKKTDKDEMQNLGMMKALRGMVCGHKLKKHLSLCDLKEFQGAEVKSEVHEAAIPEPTEDSAATSESDSVSDRADDLMAKIDKIQNSVAATLPKDANQALLDVVHSASKVSTTHHVTGAEAASLMKTDVTANLPASVRDTILSVMSDTKTSKTDVHPTPPAMNSDVTANLPASVRDTVLAVMKESKH